MSTPRSRSSGAVAGARTRPASLRTRTGRAPLSFPLEWRWALLLVLGALLVRLPGIGAGLPEVYEEAYPFKRAWEMWSFGTGRPVDLNPHFFHYPSLVFYLEFLGQGLLYVALSLLGAVRSSLDFRAALIADATPFYLLGRGLIALTGALAAWGTLRFARAFGLGIGAWIAALLVALNAALIAKSQLIEVDVPLVMFVAFALGAALTLHARRTARAVVLAGLLAGLAASAKYPGALLLAPLTLAVLLPPAASGAPPERGRAAKRIGALPALALALGAALIAFALTSPYALIDWRNALEDLASERQHQELGHFGDRAIASSRYFVSAWFGNIAGWPLALTALAGLALAARDRRTWIVASFAVALAAVLARTHVQADRYLLPLIPVAAMFAGVAVEWLLARRALAALASRVRAALAAVAVLILVSPSLPAIARSFTSRASDPRTEAKRWIEAIVPPGSMIAIEAYGPPVVGAIDLLDLDASLRRALEARGWDPHIYATQVVPSFQVLPRRSARFYQPSLYRDADAFVVTESVRSRYAAEPDSFATQLAFYGSLAARFPRRQEFGSTDGATALTVFWHGRSSDRFGDRAAAGADSALVKLGDSTGGEAYFHYNLGANYEAFGKAREAAVAYQLALRYPGSRDRIHTKAATRLARLLERGGLREEAIALLRGIEARPIDPDEAETLARVRRRIEAGR